MEKSLTNPEDADEALDREGGAGDRAQEGHDVQQFWICGLTYPFGAAVSVAK